MFLLAFLITYLFTPWHHLLTLVQFLQMVDILELLGDHMANIWYYESQNCFFYFHGGFLTTCISVISLIWCNLFNHCWIVYSLFSYMTYVHQLFSLYFTPLIMCGKKKLEIKAIWCNQWKKNRVHGQQWKELMIQNVQKTTIECVIQNQLSHFKEGDTSFKDTPKLPRPSVVEDKTLLEKVRQEPNTSTCTLSAEFGNSQSTINQDFHKRRLMNRCS